MNEIQRIFNREIRLKDTDESDPLGAKTGKAAKDATREMEAFDRMTGFTEKLSSSQIWV
jgi:hypothetical protein